MNDFKVLLQAVLDSSGIGKSDIAEVQKVLNKYHLNLAADLNKAELIKTVKQIVPELEAELKKITGIDIKINEADLLKAINQVEKDSIKAAKAATNAAKEAEKAAQQAAKEEEKLAESMEKVRAKSELAAKAEEKRQQLAQDKASNRALEEEYALREKIALQSKEIQLSTGDNGNTTTQIQSLSNSFFKLGLSGDEVKQKMSAVNAEFAQLKSVMASGDNAAIVNQFSKLNAVIGETNNDLKTLRSEQSLLASESRKLSSANSMATWLENNSKASKLFGADIKQWINTLRSADDLTVPELQKIEVAFNKIQISSRDMGLLGKTWGDSFNDMKSKFTSWLSVSGSIMLFIQQLKESVSELKNINTILTEISKTNDTLSKSDLMNLGGSSFSVASKYGKKASDYLLGVQEASRAGYSNANGIAELSVLAQSAGDMTAELANKYLIATDAAYQLQGQTDKLNAVLDGQNEVTNRNAVNMSDLAEATRVTASQAESSQIKINEMTAAVGTMIASTQQGGDVAGRAFKAILMNLQQVKGVVDEETGEIIDEDQLSKYEKAAENLGVSLKEVKDGYLALRNPMEILKELSTAYNSLQPDDSRRADLISAIGGKQRGNQLDALLKNWSKYEKMLNVYSEGSGSAFEEAMKSANNWEGSLNKLSNTITEIVDNFVEADTVIGGLNLFNGLLQGINGVTKALGDLGTIGAIGGGILGAKSLGQRNRCRYNWLRGSRSHYCYG